MKNSLFDLTGKVAVITGAGGVLAGGLARYLAKEGVQVAALDLRGEAVSDMGENIYGYACNVLDKDSLEQVYTEVMARFGKIDILLNGAGGNMAGATIPPDKTVFDLDIADYGKVLDLNLKGTLLPTMVFAKAMAESGSGSIVNFSSMSATQPLTRVLGYGNAKAGIDNLTKFLANELSTKFSPNIRVNAIAPGFFITNQNRALLTNEDGSYTERGGDVIRKTPMRRFGTPDEVCGCIHYLISDAAKFVTGAVVAVDGGFSSFSGV